ncbi:MAG: peptidylprolyl isomerase [Capsulimonadaceae bacterium]|nr:peptidylprolyl isomerase [Capsulimonadaceae bacterium]
MTMVAPAALAADPVPAPAPAPPAAAAPAPPAAPAAPAVNAAPAAPATPAPAQAPGPGLPPPPPTNVPAPAPGRPMPPQFPGNMTPSRPVVTAAQVNAPGVHIVNPATIKVTGDAARVGSAVITNEELVRHFLLNGGQSALNDLIAMSIVEQEAKKQGVSVSKSELGLKYVEFKRQVLEQAPPKTTWTALLLQEGRSEEYAIEQVRLRLLVEKLMAKSVAPVELAGKRHLYHILIPTVQIPAHDAIPDAAAKAQIQQIASDIAANKITFKDAAKKYSLDDQTKVAGGDLGWMGKGEGLDADFEKAAFALKEGEVSAPVKSQFGYHLIYVERLGENATAAEKAKANEENRRERMSQRDLRGYMQELRGKYAVENLLLPATAPKAVVAAPKAPSAVKAKAAKPAVSKKPAK